MVWKAEAKRVEYYEATLPDGKRMKLRLTVTIPDPSVWRQTVCRFMSTLGNVLTAGRRRSWFFESLYSKTTPGFIGHQLIQDILLYGRHQVKPRVQYRMSWDRYHSQLMRYQF